MEDKAKRQPEVAVFSVCASPGGRGQREGISPHETAEITYS